MDLNSWLLSPGALLLCETVSRPTKTEGPRSPPRALRSAPRETSAWQEGQSPVSLGTLGKWLWGAPGMWTLNSEN